MVILALVSIPVVDGLVPFPSSYEGPQGPPGGPAWGSDIGIIGPDCGNVAAQDTSRGGFAEAAVSLPGSEIPAPARVRSGAMSLKAMAEPVLVPRLGYPEEADGLYLQSEEANYGLGDATDRRPGVAVAVSDRAGWRESSGLAVPGIATWVHRDLAGGLMRDNETRYDPQAIGPIAMTNYALGTWVELCGPTGRCLMGVVSDTGLLGADHADVSEAMFRVLAGDLAVGVAPVTVRGE